MIHLIIANGFEEIEALGTADILRRCGLEVELVSVTGIRTITGAHDIPIMADSLFRRGVIERSEGLILPGGMPGAKNLMLHEGLGRELVNHARRGTLIAAICAAPMVLGRLGILEGHRATCYPGFERTLRGAIIVSDEMVVSEENIITAKGPAAMKDFAFAIAERYVDRSVVNTVCRDMLFTQDTGSSLGALK